MTTTLDFSNLLSNLRDLPPRHFEQLVADIWQEYQGWNTEVMNKGPDMGLDVIGEPPNGGSKTAVQCKRYSQGNKVTSKQIQQYATLRQQWDDVHGVTVVTTSSFTKNAKELAPRVNVKCINGPTLVEVIDEYDAYEIVEWYLNGKPEDW